MNEDSIATKYDVERIVQLARAGELHNVLDEAAKQIALEDGGPNEDRVVTIVYTTLGIAADAIRLAVKS